MIVSFFLLVSYIFDKDYKPSCVRDEKVDHYARVFLSACQDYDNNARVKRDDGGKKMQQKVSTYPRVIFELVGVV